MAVQSVMYTVADLEEVRRARLTAVLCWWRRDGIGGGGGGRAELYEESSQYPHASAS